LKISGNKLARLH